jgi:hypothetical protein
MHRGFGITNGLKGHQRSVICRTPDIAPCSEADCSKRSLSLARLPQVAPADLHVPILGQLAPAQLLLSDALEPGPLEIVRLNAALGGRPLRQ